MQVSLILYPLLMLTMIIINSLVSVAFWNHSFRSIFILLLISSFLCIVIISLFSYLWFWFTTFTLSYCLFIIFSDIVLWIFCKCNLQSEKEFSIQMVGGGREGSLIKGHIICRSLSTFTSQRIFFPMEMYLKLLHLNIIPDFHMYVV